jgi:hypothetical protein
MPAEMSDRARLFPTHKSISHRREQHLTVVAF